MLRTQVASHHAQHRKQYGGIVGKAKKRQHVGHKVERQHEIGERADQRGLHLQRRVAIEGAIIGGEQILGERQAGTDTAYLAPEAAAYRLLVAREFARVGGGPYVIEADYPLAA